MWSGEGGVDERGGEGRVSPAQPPPDMVSSSTSPSPAAVDLSLKSTTQGCSLSEEEEVEGIAETSSPPTSTSAAQTGLREYSSIKEVLLEMTNRKNGHSKLPPARWGIMKKEADQVLLKVPKFVVDDKKGAFPRPTAFVNPFPADGIPPNGATLQTSIKDWLNGNKIDLSPRELNKHCTVPKAGKISIRQRLPRSTNGRVMRKRPLTTIVAQLAGNLQNSQTVNIAQTNSEPVQTMIKPISSETVSFLAPHRLSGGEVSITEISPDVNVIDRLKRLGTVIEVEEQAEKDSLKLLEKMTKSVASDVDVTPISKTAKHPSKPPNSRQGSIQRSKLQSPQDLTKNSPIQLTVPSEMPIITLINVPSEQSVHIPLEQVQSAKNQCVPELSITSNQMTKAMTTNKAFSIPVTQMPIPQGSQTPVWSSSTDQLPKVQTKTNQSSKAQSQAAAQVNCNNQNTDMNSIQPSSQSLKDLPFLISIPPKIKFTQRSKPLNVKMTKPKTPAKSKVLQPSQLPISNQQQPVIPLSSTPLTAHLYISKDVTLIPKPLSETFHDKIEPSLLEPVIDIVEEDNALIQDGTFLFRTDSFHNIALPNDQKVFSCDICSAVYTHSNMMRKHYLRLHISRKYISEKDMETFNIDPELSPEKNQDNLVFRCHTCRECFASKNDLRSHLTDHPPVDELAKQSNKPHPTYKCENCSAVFKWRKQFGKHKKLCKVSPPTPTTDKTDLFHCLYCNETFLNANAKRNHILSIHPYVRRKHCCVFCKRDGFPTNVSLFSHLLNDHPTVYFACQICKERFTHLEDLKVHVDERHEQDDKLKSSMSVRVSTIKQDKIFYSCDTCQRKFLIKKSFIEHVCFPEKQEKPKLQKIKKKVHSERSEKHARAVDLETLFFSRVARNVRDNLLHHLDGKIYKEDSSDEGDNGNQSSNSSRTFLNFSDGFPSSSEILMDQSGADTPTRVKAPWEKYNFPKNYDGRCGLSSYIKDTAYLDISTQLIMRRNLQRLNMLPMRESPSDDVPSAVALERLSAECAESFGSIKKEKIDGTPEEEPELSGEWVRARMYVCSACGWETPCLWTMEDHKYLAHPRVHCPQHELIGEQAGLSQTLYKRLIYEEEPPFKGEISPPAVPFASLSCTKCGKSGFTNQSDLHIHILECAGVVVEAVGPPSKKRRRRSRRRPRRGLKRNIPQTPQKLPPKQRTKPGDTDTIQRMIANLPAKRVSRKVLSSFEENKARLNAQKNKVVKGGKNKKTKEEEKRSQSEPPRTPIKDHEKPMILQKPILIRKEQDYIDTSAEGGDVLSSLRMMPVRGIRVPAVTPIVEPTFIEVHDDPPSFVQVDDKEMPTLEIEKDISPVESSEIPVLSPVESTGKEERKEKDDLICGISFVDGKITYETITSVSEETQNLNLAARKRKSVTTSGPKKKKPFKGKRSSKEIENQEPVVSELEDSTEVWSAPNETLEPNKSFVIKPTSPKQKGKKVTKSIDNVSEDISSATDVIPSSDITVESEILSNLTSSPKQKGTKSIKSNISEDVSSAELSVSVSNILEPEKKAKKSVSPKQRAKKNNKSVVDNVESNVTDLIPDILELEKHQTLTSTSRQRGKKLNKESNDNNEENISSGYAAIPSVLDSSDVKPTAIRQRRKKCVTSLTDVVTEDIVSSAEDIVSSAEDNAMVADISDPGKPLKPNVSKQRKKKSSKTSTDPVNENAVDTSVDDAIPSTPDVLEPTKFIPTKPRGKQSNKPSIDVEENVLSASDAIPDVLESEILSFPKYLLPKQKGKKSNKVSADSVVEDNASSASDVTPIVPDFLESEKLPATIPSTQKQKGKKSNKVSADSIVEEKVMSVSDITPLIPDVLESETLPTTIPSTPKKKGRKSNKVSADSFVEEKVMSVSDITPLIPDVLESETLPTTIPSTPKKKGRKSNKVSADSFVEEKVMSVSDITPLVTDVLESETLPTTIPSTPKKKGRKSNKVSADSIVEEKVLSVSDVTPLVPGVLESETLPTTIPSTPKKKGRKSNKVSADSIVEETASYVSDVTPIVPDVLESETLQTSTPSTPKKKCKKSNIPIVNTYLIVPDMSEPEDLPTPKCSITKAKGRKSNKTSDDLVIEDEVSSFSDISPMVPDVLESEKFPTASSSTPKQKGKKPNLPIVDTVTSENVLSISDAIPPVPDIVESNKISPKQKNKRGGKLLKEQFNVEDIVSDTNIQPLGTEEAGKEIKIIPNEIGKKVIIDLPSDATVTESEISEIEKPVELTCTEIDTLLTKPKGRRSIKKPQQAPVTSCGIVEESEDIEKLSIAPPNKIIFKGRMTTEKLEPVTIRRGRGRPRGSLTRRFISLETRKSSRKTLNNDLSSVKYDEILPCEEDEVQEIVKKPEKPARKPRTVKEPPSSDSTTIVVEVEIHPEPTLKRKLAETNLTQLDSESSAVSKKMRDDINNISELEKTNVIPENIVIAVEDIPCQIADVSQIDDINNKNDMGSIVETSSNIVQQTEINNLPDKSDLSPQKDKTETILKYDKKKLDISLSPSKSVTCYNSPTIEKEVFGNSAQNQSKAIDVYEFVDNDISENCSNNSNSAINIDKDPIVKSDEIKEDVMSAKKDEPFEKNVNIIISEDIISVEVESNLLDSVTNDIPETVSNIIEETIITEDTDETGVPVKKKKLAKKITKVKKKAIKSPTILDTNLEDIIVESSEVEADNLEFVEKPNDPEKDKIKKVKKQGKKELCEAQIVDVKKLKKEVTELLDTKKLKKLVKKKKVIKKMVKAKKRILNKPLKGSEVMNIGGFTWEVSELEAPQLEESESPQQPDSSVGELELKLGALEELPPPKLELPAPLPTEVRELSSVLLSTLQPAVQSLSSPQPSFQPPASTSKSAVISKSSPVKADKTVTSMLHSTNADKPVTSMRPPASTHKPVTALEPSTMIAPSSRQPLGLTCASITSLRQSAALAPLVSNSSLRHPTPSTTVHTWEAPWGTPPDTSIGTIIDSVNKLLNDPESAFTPLGLPNYSLADLQKAMGASDDEMAVLQQLGEASLQIAATDESAAIKTETDDWNGEKCIMDLDSQTALQKQPTAPTSPSTYIIPDLDIPCEPNSLISNDEEEWQWRDKSPSRPEAGSSSLLAAHQGKEVLCPSCSCHFMGFPALQKHLVKAHPTVDPASKQKRGAGTPFTKTDLNRIIPMDSSKGPRLICFTCEQILPSDRMGLHLDQEHGIAPEEVSKCANLHGESHEGPVIGERLKSKMSLKLGDLLDRAVNNLLQAKHKPNNTLSGGAVELLARLCAVRKREGSVKHRLHGARELLSKLQRQQEMKDDDEVKVVKKLFSCSICGLKFSLPSSRNKHEVLAHRSYRPIEREYDEYENDWREAPSPPDMMGENGEVAITPQCSDCGLSFDSIQEMMRHRIEDHTVRRPSVDTIVTTGTGCCPSPVPSSGGSRSQPDSESEVAESEATSTTIGAGGATGKPRSNKFRRHGLSRNGSKLVKEKAEAALRELNHLRQRPCEGRRWPLLKGNGKANEVYNFTDDSL